MATYIGYYTAAARWSIPAFTYNSTTKALTAVSNKVEFESVPGDYWAIKINTDYALAFDSDGLLIGGVVTGKAADSEVPRIDFYAVTCGLRTPIASVTQTGTLYVPDIAEADVMPASGVMNLMNNIGFGPRLTTVVASPVNEVWFVAHNGDYLTRNGRLLMLRP